MPLADRMATPAALLPRVASAEQALNSLRQATGLSRSPTISPPPVPQVGVTVPAQLLQQHLAPAAAAAVPVSVMNGAVAFTTHHQ